MHTCLWRAVYEACEARRQPGLQLQRVDSALRGGAGGNRGICADTTPCNCFLRFKGDMGRQCLRARGLVD